MYAPNYKTLICYLSASFLSTALSGLQPIFILSWLQPFFLLRFLHHTHPSPFKTSLLLLLSAILAQALGFSLAFAGMLNTSSSFRFRSIYPVLLISSLLWLILLLPFLSHLQYRRRFGAAVASQPLVFASIWTALWHLSACFNPLGSVGNPSYSQSSFQSFVLTARLWGLEGVVFLMAWTAAVAHESLVLKESNEPEVQLDRTIRSTFTENGKDYSSEVVSVHEESTGLVEAAQCEPSERNGRSTIDGINADKNSHDSCTSRSCNRFSQANALGNRNVCWQPKDHVAMAKAWALHLRVWVMVLLLSLAIGGAQLVLFSGTFFQRSIEETIKPTVPASCVLRSSSSDVNLLWNETLHRIAAGDALIMWPEAAGGTVVGDEGEAVFLAKASKIISQGLQMREKMGGKLGPYLGITYLKQRNKETGSSDELFNYFALILPDGSVGFTYAKTHPVYIAGEDISAGPGILKVVDTPIGRISAAICFDFEFPLLMRQAGNLGVDIMLETAETWGTIGQLEFQSDAFRAVENGFTMVRCSLNGISGIVTPLYQVIDYREGLESSVLTMQLPIASRIWTPYSSFGFYFGWIVDAVALLYIFFSWGPTYAIERIVVCLPKPAQVFLTGEYVDKGYVERCQNKIISLRK